MAHDFLDGIPEQFGTKAAKFFTQSMANLMLRATNASNIHDKLVELQNRWGVVDTKRIGSKENRQHYAGQLTHIAQGVIREMDAINEALPQALNESVQKVRFQKDKVSLAQWDEAFTTPWNTLKNTLARYCTHPHEWQEAATLMPRDIGKNAFIKHAYTQQFEKDLNMLERQLLNSSANFTDATRPLAGSGHSRGR